MTDADRHTPLRGRYGGQGRAGGDTTGDDATGGNGRAPTPPAAGGGDAPGDREAGSGAAGGRAGSGASGSVPPVARWAWYAMAITVGAELALGVATLIAVPIGRPSGFLPPTGRPVYVLHAALGAGLLLGAAALLVLTRRAPRVERGAAIVGFGGLLLGGVGGLLTADHGQRSLGIAVMFVGSMVSGLAYLAGSMERTPSVREPD